MPVQLVFPGAAMDGKSLYELIEAEKVGHSFGHSAMQQQAKQDSLYWTCHPRWTEINECKPSLFSRVHRR